MYRIIKMNQGNLGLILSELKLGSESTLRLLSDYVQNEEDSMYLACKLSRAPQGYIKGEVPMQVDWNVLTDSFAERFLRFDILSAKTAFTPVRDQVT